MTVSMSRRAFLALTATPALLAACSSSTIESPLTPTRFLAVGDALSDLGQGATGKRYTINNTIGTVNIWAEQVATSYGLTLKAQASGGTSYAQGGALVEQSSGETVPSIQTQITSLLGSLSTGGISSTDVILVSAGIADLVAQVTANGISSTTTANVQTAGKALATQVRRLITAGCQHVVVAGLYHMGISPWAVSQGQESAITQLALAFNDAFLSSVVDLGDNLFYVDTAYYTNLLYASPSSYGLSDVKSKACTVDAIECDASESADLSTTDYDNLLFADSLYFTPEVHRLFGTWAYNKLRDRW